MNVIPESLEPLAVAISTLRPYGSNPRRGDVAAIVESLKVNGQYRPIVVRSETNEVLAGNHTLLAARELGCTEIAATFIECTDDQASRIVLVDNRTNDLAELLAGASGDPVGLTDADDAPPLLEDPPVSKPGDIWILGPHRVLCGDATDQAAVLDMLEGDQPDSVWTDPPYGVSYVGGTSDHLTITNDEKGDLPELLPAAFRTLAAVARPGAPVYIAHADTERVLFETSMREAGLLVRQNLVWVKNALVMGRSDYHYQHEPILEAEVLEPDHAPVLYGFTPGGKGRLGRGGERWHGDNRPSTVFEVPKPKRSAEHPTMKPVELILAQLRNSCPLGGLVLDLFGGSGSTLIAAHHLKARAALVELDPRYVDVICRRYQQHAGVTPVLKSTGKPHAFVG